MTAYIIRRILITIPVLVGISILTFVMIHLTPGEPSHLEEEAGDVDLIALEEWRDRQGLNDPIIVQYGRWIGNVLQGDFGESLLQQGVKVSDLIKARLPNTLLLMAVSTLFAIVIAIPIGVYSATRPYSKTDYVVTTFSFLGVATPNFWLGLMLLTFLSVQLGWFPTGGVASLGADFNILDRLHHLVLPAFVLGTADMAGLTRYTRSGMMDVLDQDYIRTARAKGFRQGKVIYKHGIKNALSPLITIFGLMLPSFIGGAVVTESIFSWPGIGLLFMDSVFQRDYPLIMALTLISAVLVVIGNLIADILYAVVDPRVEY